MLSLDVVVQVRQIFDAYRYDDNALWNQFEHLCQSCQFDKSKALLQSNQPRRTQFDNCFRYVMAREVLNAICYGRSEDYHILAIEIRLALGRFFPDHRWQVIVGDSFFFLGYYRRFIAFCVGGLEITIINPSIKN